MPKELTELQRSLESSLQEGIYLIPGHMRQSVIDYVVHRHPPGDFLHAVLVNDLCESAARADDLNGRCLKGWAQFMYWHVPTAARGSEQRVKNWLAEDPRGPTASLPTD